MISVVIPTYNRVDVLPRSVMSVLGQTYADIEVIVVDDCSTDETMAYLASVDDARLKVVQMPENGGACAARNRGIAETKGDYVAFQDSDDAWRPDKLQKQLDALLSTEADVCICRMERHGYPAGSERVIPTLDAGSVSRKDIVCRSIASTQTIMAARHVFDDALFDPDMPRFQDYEWAIRASADHAFVLVDEVLVDAFLQDDSITSTDARKMLGAYRLLMDKHGQLACRYPCFKAELFARMGECSTRLGDADHARSLFWMSWRAHKTPKAFVRAIMATLGLMGLYYGRNARSNRNT